MFSRVVSNFRKKARNSRKSLKTSISSPELKNNALEKRHSGRTFSAEFDFDCDEDLGEALSVCDNVTDSAQNKSLAIIEDKPETSDSGANHSQKINNIRKLLNLMISINDIVCSRAANDHKTYCLFTVLSGKRCSEMSIVYDDIQAVTRLLQEKEKVISFINLSETNLSSNFLGFGVNGAHWKGTSFTKWKIRKESQRIRI